MTKTQRKRARFAPRDLKRTLKGNDNPFDEYKHDKAHAKGMHLGRVDTNREIVVPPAGHLYSRIFRWTGTSNGGAAFTGSSLTGYNGTMQGVVLSCGVAPTSDATFDLLISGTSVKTLTVLSGDTSTEIYNLDDLPFQETDTFVVEQTTPQDSGADYIMWVYVKVDLR
jgi:hypothetical protein